MRDHYTTTMLWKMVETMHKTFSNVKLIFNADFFFSSSSSSSSSFSLSDFYRSFQFCLLSVCRCQCKWLYLLFHLSCAPVARRKTQWKDMMQEVHFSIFQSCSVCVFAQKEEPICTGKINTTCDVPIIQTDTKWVVMTLAMAVWIEKPRACAKARRPFYTKNS